ncbi:HNH endonuclease [Nocardioides currus]|uniref:HNH endonuclease n=1 Tax=Nocardioides currus TaxID=2133958 RepID=UPI0010572E61|nr:HNH endonuclease signature motif containing protein [Nocardioides currus]
MTLLKSISDFTLNSAAYRASAASSSLHKATAEDYEIVGIADADFHQLYKSRLARPGSPAYQYYERLRTSAAHGLCAYCRYGQAKTLDHFIPKTTIAGLSIEPWNLVPCCHQCNHKLGRNWSDQAHEQMLHPYFAPDLGRWLAAEVHPTRPASVSFQAVPDPTLPDGLRRQVVNQFEALGLAELYAVVSSQELAGLSRRLVSVGDEIDIPSYLDELATLAFCGDLNDRRGVLYEALSQSSWYCDGGFADV